MPTPVYGVVSLRIDGNAYDIAGEWTYDIGGTGRESVIGANGLVGHKIVPRAAYIEGNVFDRGDLSLEQLRSIQDSTATLHLRNGKTVWLRGAAQVGELTVAANEGTIQLRLEGVAGGEA